MKRDLTIWATTEKTGEIGLHFADMMGFHFRVNVTEKQAAEFAANIREAIETLPRVAVAADFGMQEAA